MPQEAARSREVALSLEVSMFARFAVARVRVSCYCAILAQSIRLRVVVAVLLARMYCYCAICNALLYLLRRMLQAGAKH